MKSGYIIVGTKWTRWLTFGRAQAITLFPFIFILNRDLAGNVWLLNHERIHIRQCLELLILPFYLLYFVEFLYRLVQFRNFTAAYENISFEKEAYTFQHDVDYLKKRKFFAQWR